MHIYIYIYMHTYTYYVYLSLSISLSSLSLYIYIYIHKYNGHLQAAEDRLELGDAHPGALAAAPRHRLHGLESYSLLVVCCLRFLLLLLVFLFCWSSLS